jgi:hypothetical protein
VITLSTALRTAEHDLVNLSEFCYIFRIYILILYHYSDNFKMSTAELIRQKVEELPPGQPFTSSEFLSLGQRTTVDKTLARMVQAGILAKPTRGVFVRPKHSKFGTVPPEPLEVAVAKAHGQQVGIHGAEALRCLGLSTQVPVRPVFYTTGRSRTFNVGRTSVRLQQVSPRKLVYPGTKVGMAISALWYLGKEKVKNEVFEAIRANLSTEEYEALKAAAPMMPGWMVGALHRYEKRRCNG